MESCVARGLSVSKNLKMKNSPLVLLRGKSTAAKPNSAPKVQATPPPTTAQASITWPEYLAIRRNKRRVQTALTIPTTLLGLALGGLYFGNLDTDPTKLIMGIDPFFFYGFCTLGCAGAGALAGPTIGASIWRFKNRNILSVLDKKDHDFFQRIAKNRVDATLQSPTHPVPDYYGEKIGSLHQYRQWLRDQAKYKRKALLPEE
ncbi:Presequence translocated-associated motor subunit PAM17, mitochondrial [Psilocybe cubensis]|uniref:Presequence translocated-associated motor subunit PAM17, mitochondrial n=2 Tax=Psilocybe cubensis TaxID=181762 RepID=A0ACB8H9D7_PSICU|nr:Presequence translocated-associated motor subunit PAM17, mitochondrial [Psilocybe cubensis]KAH9484423.1 Presequence translocated-associated motor subunit PAM17, mitochondrial [Psilocybe cubensis]